ncbi:TVP38/TMEM64 family protein [Streptomyces boninensis]|uniref:TVP38/TMEM64 family protein n=1 Tax=Streptomyces boninensis TaxID=2039455 RepID=UPI003B224780
MDRPVAASDGLPAACLRAVTHPWSRLGLLVALLVAAAVAVAVFQPQELISNGRLLAVTGAPAVAFFGLAYGLCTAALVPRPLLNLASGALFGLQGGLAAAVAGTVIGAGISFGLGRVLGQAALRGPVQRARWLAAADRHLSRHGFRSMLALRVFPGVPFAAANYCAAVSRMGWTPFLAATAVGCVPNTAAYVVAGSSASDPLSPGFFAALAFIVISAGAGAGVAWRRRRRSAAARVAVPVADPAVGALTPGP